MKRKAFRKDKAIASNIAQIMPFILKPSNNQEATNKTAASIKKLSAPTSQPVRSVRYAPSVVFNMATTIATINAVLRFFTSIPSNTFAAINPATCLSSETGDF